MVQKIKQNPVQSLSIASRNKIQFKKIKKVDDQIQERDRSTEQKRTAIFTLSLCSGKPCFNFHYLLQKDFGDFHNPATS